MPSTMKGKEYAGELAQISALAKDISENKLKAKKILQRGLV